MLQRPNLSRCVSLKYLPHTLYPQYSVFIFIFNFSLKLSRLPANCNLPALDHQPDPESHFFIYDGMGVGQGVLLINWANILTLRKIKMIIVWGLREF